jgi:ParB family transcriptional regulator, chromosome partitioning protein
MLTNEPKIEMVATSALIPYARNAKRHDDAQVAKLAGSIREYGFTNPVLIDADNGIIAGHGRVLGAQKLGLADVPCIRLSHLTEMQKRAYVLADNRLAEIGGGWDAEMLRIEVEELREAGVDLDGIGLDAEALADLTSAFDAKEAGMPELASGDKQPFQQKTFTLHDEQAEDVDAAVAKAKQMGHGESGVNENSNGNALAFVCQSFNRANP